MPRAVKSARPEPDEANPEEASPAKRKTKGRNRTVITPEAARAIEQILAIDPKLANPELQQHMSGWLVPPGMAMPMVAAGKKPKKAVALKKPRKAPVKKASKVIIDNSNILMPYHDITDDPYFIRV